MIKQFSLTSFFGEHKTFSDEKELREHLSFYNPTMLAAVAIQLREQGYKIDGSGAKLSLLPVEPKTSNGEDCVVVSLKIV